MTLTERLTEIQIKYNYWVGNFSRKELTANNVRIVAESVCKAVIIVNQNEVSGTAIILGQNNALPKKRTAYLGQPLKFADLISALNDLKIFRNAKDIQLHLELIRDRTNPSSHSSNKPKDDTSLDDIEVCNISINQILKWLYADILQQPIPESILRGFKGEQDTSLISFASEKWADFDLACKGFDKRKYQFIFVAPSLISGEQYILESLARLPWRLVIDFNTKSDEEENGLLFNFNRIKGQGYKKAYTLDDKIEFDPNFPHYWFFANGQGSGLADTYKEWRAKLKTFLSDTLYFQFNKGSRVKSRVVVLLDILPLYAELIIEEFNRLDEANLQFVLCSETEDYENVFQKINNVRLVRISGADIANGADATYRPSIDSSDGSILVPVLREDKRMFSKITRDHFDYLNSLGIDLVFKGIEATVPPDDSFSFYKGSVITWRDLAEQKDLSRTNLENIRKRLEAKLQDNRLAEIHLIHEAGSGGTTVARRIAFDFSSRYPTVVLRKYQSKKTIDGFRILIDHYTKGSLPILIIIESFEVGDSHLLYRDLSNTKKNAILFVVHRGILQKAQDKKFILKAQLEGTEINAFENTYSQLAPTAKEKIRKIPFDYQNDPKYINPVLYALTAFGKDYHGLDNYILKCLKGITLEQRKLAGFLCLIYHYTQMSVPGELFSALFKVDRSKCDLANILGQESPLLELLHQEAGTDEYYNVWRPRYALLGDEAMEIILSGSVEQKRNWRTHLAGWLVELIKSIKLSMPYLDTETMDLFNALFIQRANIYDDSFDKEFTKVVKDLPSPTDGIAVFEELTNAYPNEAHFHGHFARFLYSGKVGIKNYDRAIQEAERSLEIYKNNSSLIHTLGMCYREKTENLIYSFEQQGLTSDEVEQSVKELTESACDIFDECIECDPLNIYGYESQIRTILKTLDFGFKIHQSASKESFITNPSNGWYAEKLDKVSRLLEEALYVIEQEKKIENKERIERSAGYIYDCEAIFFKTLGKHVTAKNRFEELVKNTPKGYEYMRPHFRRMFIVCLLASKAKSQRELFEAWNEMSEAELIQCVTYLDANIFEDPTNTQNIRLWLQAVRNLKTVPTLENCISKISAWTQTNNQNSNSLLEGYYYLYVLNSIKAISKGNSFDPTTVEVVNEILQKMKPFIKNEKFCFEWYGKGNDLKQLVNHKVLGDYSSDFFERNQKVLADVTGRIKEINSSQQGLIVLDCGLPAFFVPNVGGFTERNINDRIKCFIGFRYDQIQAWSVILMNTDRKETYPRNQSLIEINELLEENETINEQPADKVADDIRTVRSELPKLTGPKVVGRIDVKKSVKKLPKAPEIGKSYSGLIKALKKDSQTGFVSVIGIDKDVAFRASHLRKCSFNDLTINMSVQISVGFFKGAPKADQSGRNYIAEALTIKV